LLPRVASLARESSEGRGGSRPTFRRRSTKVTCALCSSRNPRMSRRASAARPLRAARSVRSARAGGPGGARSDFERYVDFPALSCLQAPRLACIRRQIPKLDVAGSTPVARS